MNMNVMNCIGCHEPLASGAKVLTCTMCKGNSHFECLNIKPHEYATLSEEFRASWKCPCCNNITRRTRSGKISANDDMNMSCDNMDQRPAAISPNNQPEKFGAQELGEASNYVSQHLHSTLDGWRNDITQMLAVFKKEITGMLHGWREELEVGMSKINSDLKNTLTDIKEEVNTLRASQTCLKQHVATISQDVLDLQTSLEFHANQQSDFKKQLDETARHNSEHSDIALSLLECKLDSLEQQARQCNIEICNIPDTRGENLPKLFESLCMLVNLPVSHKDVISIHRVPHAHPQAASPKNIIVKLSTRILRDNLLAAFRRTGNIKTDQLGINGKPASIYLNEHLTLKKKQLFRKVKDLAKIHQVKYVWIKNATILIRKQDGEPATAIHTTEDLCKMQGKSKSHIDNGSISNTQQ